VAALCDVNLLLALVTDRHILHDPAVRWAENVSASGAILCRIAQMGLLRLLNNPAVMHEEAMEHGGLLVNLEPPSRRSAVRFCNAGTDWS
jgi:predicted nucleic acid-binding protein